MKQQYKLRGEITVPGDKSISHRSVMFGALAQGTTEVHNFLQGADCLSTIDCFRKLGISIENTHETITIHGKGLHGLHASDTMLDVGNSGTTTRLISGILAGQNFDTSLNGDESIQRRPMSRIMTPLSQMGARIESLKGNNCAPLLIHGCQLHGITYKSPVSSAQVKSCVLLAGLYADAPTTVIEPVLSRDHTERMLRGFGAELSCSGTTATILPDAHLIGQKINVPGDISSAAYFIAAALITPGSEVLIKNVGINPTRAGIITVAQNMNGDITLLNEHTESGEPVADLLVKYSDLKATTIEGAIIPALIDELPVIAIMAACAKGTTIIKDAAELKVKECDRIAVMVENLTAMGADITGTDDGMIITGGKDLHGATIHCHLDHRIAMSFAVADFIADGEVVLDHPECVNISYPTFYEDMKSLL